MNSFGFKWRAPKTKWENFWLLFLREHQWVRRMLGGKWEAYVHDMGTSSAIVTWHWVEEFHKNITQPLFRKEDWANPRGWTL